MTHVKVHEHPVLVAEIESVESHGRSPATYANKKAAGTAGYLQLDHVALHIFNLDPVVFAFHYATVQRALGVEICNSGILGPNVIQTLTRLTNAVRVIFLLRTKYLESPNLFDVFNVAFNVFPCLSHSIVSFGQS